MGRAGIVAAALLMGPAGAWAGWGDSDPAKGPAQVEAARGELLKLLKAPEAQREELAKALVASRGDELVEAMKRFRNPELRSLWRALLLHPDWKLRHRALLCLEHDPFPGALALAARELSGPERFLREKAAITCLKLWDPVEGKSAFGKDPAAVIAALRRSETDFHIRACLEALQRRIEGKLKPQRVSTEVLVTLPDGLRLAPFMESLAALPPGQRPAPLTQLGGVPPAKLPAPPRWTTPLLGMGREVQGVSPQPFANPREGGVYHTGVDAGASLDGSGFYAGAEGVVRMVSAGTDMGTLIVLEHSLGEGRTVCVVYMHGGDTTFVHTGDKVACGQLVGSMGLGFSVENGGHYAHLHLGVYPGPFGMMHNYGYRPMAAGLADWWDPEVFFAERVARTRPAFDLPSPLAGLDALYERCRKGQVGAAYAEILKRLDSPEPTTAEGLKSLKEALEALPGELLVRADRVRDLGFPGDALQALRRQAKALAGIPGSEGLAERSEAWGKDAVILKALSGEAEVEAAERKEPKEQLKALWEPLRAKYSDTCLSVRILSRMKYLK